MTEPVRSIWSLQDAIDEASILGIPIGASLNDALWGVTRGHWTASYTALGLVVKRLLRQQPDPGTAETLRPWSSGHPIIAVLTAPRFHGLLLPVVAELRRIGRSVTILTRKRVPLGDPPHGETLTEGELCVEDDPVWHRAIVSQVPRWMGILSSAVWRRLIPASALPHLLDSLILQSLRTQRFAKFLALAEPSAVVTDYDRGFFGSPLALAARSLKIPVLTLVHGLVGEDDPSFAPLVADMALCWGERQASALQRLGVDSHQLTVVGCPQFSTALPDKAHTRRQFGLDRSKGVVVFASSGDMPSAASQRLVSQFCGALPSGESVAGLVRLHPRESLDTYEPIQRAYPGVRIQPADNATVQQTLAVADLVVTHSSSFGDDAVANGVPAAVFDPSLPGIQRAEQVGLGWHGLHAANQPELASLIEVFMSSSEARNRWRALAAVESEAICRYRGEQASRAAAHAILRRAR